MKQSELVTPPPRKLSDYAEGLCSEIARLHDPESPALDNLPDLVRRVRNYFAELESR